MELLFVIFLLLFPPILILSLIFRIPSVKGKIGEIKVEKFIGFAYSGTQYIINNLMLRTGTNKSTQIDHVVIQPNGIFVIETKNYSGRIYGNRAQHEWTQVLNYGRVKHKLYNPLLQNKTHVYHIAQLLSHKYPIVPVVVFVKGNIKYIKAEGVYSLRGLRQVLNSGNDILTESQMQEVYQILTTANDCSISNSDHVHHIRAQQKAIASSTCPRCGKNLVLRQGKYGAFYGCKSYPDCKFTKKC